MEQGLHCVHRICMLMLPRVTPVKRGEGLEWLPAALDIPSRSCRPDPSSGIMRRERYPLTRKPLQSLVTQVGILSCSGKSHDGGKCQAHTRPGTMPCHSRGKRAQTHAVINPPLCSAFGRGYLFHLVDANGVEHSAKLVSVFRTVDILWMGSKHSHPGLEQKESDRRIIEGQGIDARCKSNIVRVAPSFAAT